MSTNEPDADDPQSPDPHDETYSQGQSKAPRRSQQHGSHCARRCRRSRMLRCGRRCGYPRLLLLLELLYTDYRVKTGHTDVVRLIPFKPNLQVMSICDQVVEVLQGVLALASRQAVNCLGECSCQASITALQQRTREEREKGRDTYQQERYSSTP